MSNFTRSILYSTSVLVAGLVAIFAIYNNVANLPEGAGIAQISPAAGNSDIGISYDSSASNIEDDTLSAPSFDAQNVVGPTTQEIDDADNVIDSAVDDIVSDVSDAVDEN